MVVNFSHVEDRSRSGPQPNVVHKMPTIKRVVFESKKPAQRKKISNDLIPIKVASRPQKSDRTVSIEPEPKK